MWRVRLHDSMEQNIRAAVRTAHERTVGALLEQYGVDLVIDVGARTGEFGRLVRSTGFSGPIWSFEPVATSFRSLATAAADDPCWEVRNTALGATSGWACMNVVAQSDLSSFLPISCLGHRDRRLDTTTIGIENVLVERLDDAARDRLGTALRRVFLKTDTQGMDLDVLVGAREVLRHVVGIQVEIPFQHLYLGPPSADVHLRVLGALGFELAGLFPVLRSSDGAVIEADWVGCRRSAWSP